MIDEQPPPAAGRPPWYQQTGESGPAFAAFESFLKLGPTRVMVEAYCRHTGRGDGPDQRPKSVPGNWKRWSAQFAWSARCKAYDDANAAVVDQARAGTLRALTAEATVDDWEAGRVGRQQDLEKREHELAMKLMQRVEEMLDFGLARMKKLDGPNGEHITIFEPVKWDMGDAVAGLKTASLLARLANRMAVKLAEVPVVPDAPAAEAMFTTRGQLADKVDEGVVPDMPYSPDSPPELGKTVLAGKDHGLVQPQKVRPAQ